MKIGVIIGTNEPEKAWNGVRFGNACLNEGHEVKIFLMSAGVEIPEIRHDKYNAAGQIASFMANKGTVLACGTCIKSRNQPDSEACPLSTMTDCVRMVEWADRVVSF